MNTVERKARRRPLDAILVSLLLAALLLRTITAPTTALLSVERHLSEEVRDFHDAAPSDWKWQQQQQQHRQLGARHHFEKAMRAMDFSEYSCDNLYEHAMNHTTACAYAKTCNDGDGIFAPIVFCSQTYSTRFLSVCLGIPLTLLLIILFRVLGSTAEEFFSPGLEMMSLELGLPERFAGVTLLALGNGAPDVASTVSAILNDRKLGYKMALGELTGAAMVASTVIVGAVTFVADGVVCRGALVRDVVMFVATI